VENKKIKLDDNDLLIINKDILQKYSVCKSMGDIILFSPVFLGSTQEKIDFLNHCALFQNDYAVIRARSESFAASVEFYFSSMKAQIDKGQKNHLSLLRNWLHNLLMTIEREYCFQKQFYHWDDPNNIHEIQQFRILLDMHYYEQKQVRFYAEKLDISERKLSRIVYTVHGISAKEYISEKVLSEAVRLMKNTTLTQGEIADKLGLDFTYFVKFFRKYYGITPAKYRRQEEDK
jgi:AraC-like DNA-binding protein